MSPAYSYPLSLSTKRNISFSSILSNIFSSIYAPDSSKPSAANKAPLTHNLSKSFSARLFSNPSQISHYVKSSDTLFRLKPQVLKDIGTLFFSNPDGISS